MATARKTAAARVTRAEREIRLLREGLDDIAAGRTMSLEAMEKWAESLSGPSELPLPQFGE